MEMSIKFLLQTRAGLCHMKISARKLNDSKKRFENP